MTAPRVALTGCRGRAKEAALAMASFTAITRSKRARRHQKAGHKRKAKLARKSTPSLAELFAACGEMGKPAPGVGAAATSRK